MFSAVHDVAPVGPVFASPVYRGAVLTVGAGALNAALRRLGFRVFHAGPFPDCDLVVPHPITLDRLLELAAEQGFVPDALLHMDNGNLPQVVGVEKASMPSIFYAVDTYCNPWHVPYAHAFDAVAVAQKSQLYLFVDDGHNARWMPLFATQFPEICTFAARDVPVAFVGTLDPKNIPTRKPFLQRFRARQPLVARQGVYAPLFSRSCIVLNQTAFSEINYRCFEAPACGAALLMEDAPDLTAVFTPEENCLPPYPRDNDVEAARIAAQWLADPLRLARVAKAGRRLVHEHHSDNARAREIADLFETLRQAQAPEARKRDMARRRTFLSTAYAILLLELNDPQLAAHKAFYGRLYHELVG